MKITRWLTGFLFAACLAADAPAWPQNRLDALTGANTPIGTFCALAM